MAYLRRQTARASLPLLSGRDGGDCGAVCSGPAVLPITPTGASQRGGCQPKTQLQEQHLQASQVNTQVSFGHTHTHTWLSLRPVAWEHFAQTNIFRLGAGAPASPPLPVPDQGATLGRTFPSSSDGWAMGVFLSLSLCVQKQELLSKTRLYVVVDVEIQDPVCQQMSRTRRSIC